jgi:pentatricopeptide repeat protein
MHEEALRLLDSMMEYNHLAHLESYKLLVCGLFEQGNQEKAEEIFRSLLSCEYNYDEVVWKVLLDGLVRKGHVDECSQLRDIMEKNGCRLHSDTHTMLSQELNGN